MQNRLVSKNFLISSSKLDSLCSVRRSQECWLRNRWDSPPPLQLQMRFSPLATAADMWHKTGLELTIFKMYRQSPIFFKVVRSHSLTPMFDKVDFGTLQLCRVLEQSDWRTIVIIKYSKGSLFSMLWNLT